MSPLKVSASIELAAAGDADVAGEGMELLAAGDLVDLDVAREDVDIERHVLRHLDVELGLDDVVVLLGPVIVLLVGLDGDTRRGLLISSLM
jgi:hypothetical protein